MRTDPSARRILVTGATGFVGQALCRAASKQGHDVIALVRPGSALPIVERLESAGVRVERIAAPSDAGAAVSALRPDLVVHAAAYFSRHQSAEEVDAYLDANIVLGTHILEALPSGAVFVSVTSYFQYRDGRPTPHSLYAATKQAFVEIGAYYRALRGVDVREVVLFDNYGPGDTRDKLVPHIVAGLRAGTTISLGPSRQRLDLLHVDDVARGILAAVGDGNPAVMTVRAESLTTVGEVAELLARAAGRRLEASFDESRASSDLVESAMPWPSPLGWSPQWQLSNGLRDALLS